jgi:chromatin structure-remodeling complex protein RSC7
VTDDYYEEKVLAEITEKGLKPGDPVGDLPDPNAQSQAANSQDAVNARNDRGTIVGSGMGIYRAGGPTTIFGGYGWGPYSDGPLNAVRKSILTRDGLTEENWMYKMAEKTQETNEEWNITRRDALQHRDIQDSENKRQVSIAEAGGIYEAHTGMIYCEFHSRTALSPETNFL